MTQPEIIITLDMGTTNGVFMELAHSFGLGLQVVNALAYTTNQKSLDTILGNGFCWWNADQYHENTLQQRDYFKGASLAAHSGASSTALAISDGESGEVKAMIYSKPPLNIPGSVKDGGAMEEISGKKMAELDPHYVWAKLASLASNYRMLAPVLGLPDQFDQIVVEPLIAATARTLNHLPYGVVGWGPDDWKGVTGGVEGDAQRVIDAMRVLGYNPHQFTLQETQSVQYVREDGSPLTVATRGDFLVASQAIKEWLVDSGEKNGQIDRETDVLVECGSNFKFYYMGSDETLLPYFPKQNGHGKYALIRNGAGINPDILFRMWSQEIKGYPFEFVDKQLEGHELQPKYFYYPDWSEGHSTGRLFHLDKGTLVEIDLNSDQALMNIENKVQATAAVFAGLGCRAKKQMPTAKRLAMYSGYIVPETQPHKIRMFGEPFGKQVGLDGLTMPDSGIMTAIQTLKSQNKPASMDPLVHRFHMRNGGGNSQYYNLWENIGTGKHVFRQGRIG